MCLLCQFWFVSWLAVCSCTKHTDTLSTLTSLAGGTGRCEHRAMRHVLRLCHIESQLNCMLGFTQGPSALKQLLLVCLSLSFRDCVRPVFLRKCRRCSLILAPAVVAATLHSFVARHRACLAAPHRPTYCRLSPRWSGVQDEALIAWLGPMLAFQHATLSHNFVTQNSFTHTLAKTCHCKFLCGVYQSRNNNST